jgi:ComF family protein
MLKRIETFGGNRLARWIDSCLIDAVVELFFPALCFICENNLENNRKIVCARCFQQIPVFNPAQDDDPLQQKKYNQAFILFEYTHPVRILIHLLKYNGFLTLAEYFAEAALQIFPDLLSSQYDSILPVPLHPARFRERGFNQSAILGNAIASRMHIPFREHTLIRRRNTPSQTHLNRLQRIQNVQDAFHCPIPVRNTRLLIVDDVLTTGSTINACCQILLQAGAARADILTLTHPFLDRMPQTEGGE